MVILSQLDLLFLSKNIIKTPPLEDITGVNLYNYSFKMTQWVLASWKAVISRVCEDVVFERPYLVPAIEKLLQCTSTYILVVRGKLLKIKYVKQCNQITLLNLKIHEKKIFFHNKKQIYFLLYNFFFLAFNSSSW